MTDYLAIDRMIQPDLKPHLIFFEIRFPEIISQLPTIVIAEAEAISILCPYKAVSCTTRDLRQLSA